MKRTLILVLLAVLLLPTLYSCGSGQGVDASFNSAEGGSYYEDAACAKVDMEDLEPSAYLSVPYILQEVNHCGPASLSMVMAYYGESVDQLDLGLDIVNEHGVTTGELIRRASDYGFDAKVYSCSFESLLYFVSKGKPVITRVLNYAGTNGHFVTVIGYDTESRTVFVNDPGDYESTEVSFNDFKDIWDIDSLEDKNNSWNQMILVTPSDKASSR